jgi:hypothetical protein
MVFKTITMSELRKTGNVPLSSSEIHRENIGKGNYNRFQALDQRTRTFSVGKRRLPTEDSTAEVASKTPRLDSNLIFEQLKVHEDKLKNAKQVLDETAKLCDDAFMAAHGGIGKCVNQLMTVVNLLLSHQEGLASIMIDSCRLPDPRTTNPDNNSTSKVQTPIGKKALTPEDIQAKKVRQAINRAEKSTTEFELDMGPIPVINKETMARKVTIALHDNAKKGEQVNTGKITPSDAEEMIDDLLTCASLDFLGNGTTRYRNDRKPNDPRIGKMCTVPVKLIFKGRDERMMAEKTLRQVCNVRCSTPYPKKLRKMIKDLIDEGKAIQPDHFVRVRVHSDTLRVDAHASIEGKWVDLKIEKEIPLDILDQSEMTAVDSEGDMDAQIS